MGNAWSFPTSLNVGGVDYEIRTDYRAVLDLFTALNDPELQDESEDLTAYAQTQCILKIMLPQCDDIPDENIQEALQKVSEFIDMGIRDERKKPKTMDWEQDAPIIIPAVNKVLNTEIRAQKYIHWWTFMGYYMEISEGVFSNVLSIRLKKAKGKKLEKWEREYWSANKNLCVLKPKLTAEEQAEKDRLNALLD